MKKMNEIKKNEIMEVIKEKKELSIYDLQKAMPKEHKNSYGNVYFYVKQLEKEGKIEMKKVTRDFKSIIVYKE